MTTPDSTQQRSEPLVVRPRRQLLIGLVLLVVGCSSAAGLVLAGANVASAPAFVVVVWGLAMIGNGVMLMRRSRRDESQSQSQSQDGKGFATGGAVALGLAVVLPPAGILAAAYSDTTVRRRGEGLYPLAIAVGAVLTVVYTMLIIITAALERTS